MNIEKTNNLSFYNEQGILTLTAKQFDTGRMFVFHIMHNDAPFDLSGCTAYLRIAKADGTQFQGHECCTIEGSKVIIKTNTGNGSQILTAAGTNVCELHLEDSDGISLTTWTFHIVVEPRVHDGSNMSSIDSYDVLDNMINMEKERIANEKQRLENELQRKENETNRNTVFEQKLDGTNSVITDCRLVIDTAKQKINNFDAEINEIVDGITNEAQSYADNAKASETNAANAASSATDSAAIASQKAGDAAASAVLSQSYAIGGTGSRESEDADNAKEYAKQAKASADELREGYILKTEKGAAEGVATLDGDGKIPEGQLPDNIGSVTGVKGDKENAYRTGNVNITPENVGALSLKGGTVNGKVTVNNSFMVNKVSTTNPTTITELDIHSEGKVAINTIADGTKNDSLIHFEGGRGGTITNRAGSIDSYVKNIWQHDGDLSVSSSNAIYFAPKKFGVTDDHSCGIRIGGGDVYIGDVPLASDDLSDDNGRERFWMQSYTGSNMPQTRLFTNNFRIGRDSDWFLDYGRNSTQGNHFKVRYGTKGSNIEGGYGHLTMYTNDNGIEIRNENSVLGPIGDVRLNTNDGTSSFNTDVILECSDGVHKADLYLGTGNIFGQKGSTYRYNHAIKIGHANDNVMRFYEVGRCWEFWEGENSAVFAIRYNQDDECCVVQHGGGKIEFRDREDDIYINAQGFIGLSASDDVIIFGYNSLWPYKNPYCDLGTDLSKWRNIYATNGTIQTSDRNEKNTIEELSSEKAQQLIYGLKPSTYKMNAGTSGRTHWGMISQDIEEMFEEIGMTSLDFAGFIKSPKMTEEVSNEETEKIIEESKIIEGEYNYSLRYDEFIAPIIKVIQTQHEEIDELKQRINFLEQQAQI